MPDLHRVLADHDLTLLRLIAEHWGLALAAGSQREAADELTARMLEPELAREIAGSLPSAARAAFQELARDSRQPMPQFVRRHGELRAMGTARRERERPWANAPSVTEALWYRGLIGRAFFESRQPGGQRGPEEFVFVPDDLRSLVYVAPSASGTAAAVAPPGAPAVAPINWAATLDAAADDAITLLAYLQVTPVRPEGALVPVRHRESLADFLRQPAALDLGLHLLRQLGLVADAPIKLDPEAVQPFLQAGSPERAKRLAEAWRDSREWNDLLAVPGLVFEGAGWHNDPLGARSAILALLAAVPAGAWWSLEDFIQAVKERQPDFQRPAGDYNSWYIRDAAGGAYLRGFGYWARVDGALVRWIIESPMAWLGLVETGPLEDAGEEPGEAGGPLPAAFRLTPYGAALLGQAGWPEPPEPAALEVAQPLGLVRAPAGATGHDRFQLARVSDWGRPEAGPAGAVYPYRLTPGALKRAAQKGIPPGRIIGFLERAAAGQPGLPPLLAALKRWEQHGPEASLSQAVVLRLATPQLLETLRANPAVVALLGETLGPAAVMVRPENVAALEEALAEMGILADLE